MYVSQPICPNKQPNKQTNIEAKMYIIYAQNRNSHWYQTVIYLTTKWHVINY